MVNKIEVKDTIADAIKHFPTVIGKLQELKALMDSVEGQLNDSKWTGKSRDKCRHIHEAIKLYYQKIVPLCDEMKLHTKKLQKNSTAFCNASSNISMIQSI